MAAGSSKLTVYLSGVSTAESSLSLTSNWLDELLVKRKPLSKALLSCARAADASLQPGQSLPSLQKLLQTAASASFPPALASSAPGARQGMTCPTWEHPPRRQK